MYPKWYSVANPRLSKIPGFPYPESVALASLLESVVRVNGGVPATIGILDGVARVGLDAEELIELASTAEKKNALKVSRRDLGYICGLVYDALTWIIICIKTNIHQGLAGTPLHGGTTVSGTMMLAHMAGIKVFGTGGLGMLSPYTPILLLMLVANLERWRSPGRRKLDGYFWYVQPRMRSMTGMLMHRSADLTELGRTPVAVISSGCKSFLDIPRTLEYLETEGVCVGTFADGRQGSVDFPAFFTRDSGIKSPKVIQDEAEAAAIICTFFTIPLRSVGVSCTSNTTQMRKASSLSHQASISPTRCRFNSRFQKRIWMRSLTRRSIWRKWKASKEAITHPLY